MTSAALALGLTTLVPAVSKADGRHRDDYRDGRRIERVEIRERYDYGRGRHDHRHCEPDVDRDIRLSDVPRRVMETADCERRGARIEAVQFVRRDGHEFYRFRIDHGRGCDMNIRVARDGGLLGIEEAGPVARVDVGWRR